MRYWIVRVLLNLAALVVACLVAFAGLMTTGSLLPPALSALVSIGLGILLYFFLSWSLAIEATRGRAQVGLGAYLRPLFFTYWLLGSLGIVAFLIYSAFWLIDTMAPEGPVEFTISVDFWTVVAIVGIGLGFSLVLMIPPLVAIVDRPPPGESLDVPDPADGQISGDVAPPPALAASVSIEQGRQDQLPQPQAAIPTDADREETLEELLGLEPTRHG